jgi:anti-sigma regulatory factor (Ser/Thr protein kinase)
MSAQRWPHTRRRDRRAVCESFMIAGGVDAPHAAREAVEGVLAGHVSQESLDDARLMVSELACNSVMHGGACEGLAFELTVALLPSVLRVEVADPMGGFDPPRSPLGAETGEGGPGLALVGLLSSCWGVQPSPPGTVWFELRRPRRNGASNGSINGASNGHPALAATSVAAPAASVAAPAEVAADPMVRGVHLGPSVSPAASTLAAVGTQRAERPVGEDEREHRTP